MTLGFVEASKFFGSTEENVQTDQLKLQSTVSGSKRTAFDVAVDAELTVDDTGILREAVLCGMGLACLPDRLVAPLVEAGRLVRVLDEFCPAQSGFFCTTP
ncbi:LysR substrate-binding domain-containing protein [Martelella mediterranea]|uniref:LysR substrate-binding domain-containing protein n=1 Tax=Martelella mediterranea TaxID=293089 RepID=UPI002E7AE604|nr:LysR substrate-binding domain-containing protein [Martelella mediterranea]